MNMDANSIWQPPAQDPDVSGDRPGRSEGDLITWRNLTARVMEIARRNGWPKAEAARRIGMPDGTFSQWYGGNYTGRLDTQNLKVAQWLESTESAAALAQALPDAPTFVTTRTSQEIFRTLELAQMSPDMVIITLAAGMGKTHTTRYYCATRPHAFRVTMRPQTKTCHAMLVEIARCLAVIETNPAKLDSAIGARLQRNGRQTLLVIDEAQNIEDRAVDQLRYFLDEYGCGIALTGTTSVYGRFKDRQGGPDYAQIQTRTGKRLNRHQPYPEDITALIDAWNIDDAEQRKLLTGIGRKPGHLRNVDKTLRLAFLLAAGERAPLSVKHISAAYQNREWED